MGHLTACRAGLAASTRSPIRPKAVKMSDSGEIRTYLGANRFLQNFVYIECRGKSEMDRDINGREQVCLRLCFNENLAVTGANTDHR